MFVQEAQRGAACGCFCPVCDSPLVAKQGDKKEWHFAHEKHQERPECAAGAMNLMRRIAAEWLARSAPPVLPTYRRLLRGISTGEVFREEVSWNAQFLPGTLQWSASGGPSEPLATGELDNGLNVSIRLVVSESRPHWPEAHDDQVAQVLFWLPPPSSVDMKDAAAAHRHIQQHLAIIWEHQPDVFGLVKAAENRIAEKVKASNKATADAAGRRWVAIRDAGLNRFKGEIEHAVQPREGVSLSPPAKTRQEPVYSWAPHRKPASSFIFYKLRDGSAWVLYTRQDASQWLVPWGTLPEGWDEALPPSVGTPDLQEGMYRVRDSIAALTFLSARSVCTRTNSDPTEFGELARPDIA